MSLRVECKPEANQAIDQRLATVRNQYSEAENVENVHDQDAMELLGVDLRILPLASERNQRKIVFVTIQRLK